MTSWPYSRSCRTASIRSGRAAGLAGELVIYWLKAGQQTLARSAMTEAVAQLERIRLASVYSQTRRREAKRCCGLEVDDQLDLGAILDREISRVAGQNGRNGIRDEPTPGGAGSLDHARFARNATPFE
jgi:hypothetical protein